LSEQRHATSSGGSGSFTEAGVEVNVEVPGTWAVLGVEQVWPEEDQRRRSRHDGDGGSSGVAGARR
jgi:hypothetical protein